MAPQGLLSLDLPEQKGNTMRPSRNPHPYIQTGNSIKVLKPHRTLVASPNPAYGRCILRSNERHPLYACEVYRNISQDEKWSILKSRNLYFNCLRAGHAASKCNSAYHCKKCRRLHHTMLHLDDVSRDHCWGCRKKTVHPRRKEQSRPFSRKNK